MKNEIWKDIPNYEGLYQASSLGRIKSLKRIVKHSSGGNKTLSERILIQKINNKGRKSLWLCKNGATKEYLVSRLIALTFIINPNKKINLVVGHIDNNPCNNRVENLKWITYSENTKWMFKCHREKLNPCKGKKHYKSIPIVQYDLKGNFIKEWECASEVERIIGLCRTQISKNVKGKILSAYGYIWKSNKAFNKQ